MTHEIVVEAYPENRRPYRATVYEDGVFLAQTGFCATRDRATRIAEQIIMRRINRR